MSLSRLDDDFLIEIDWEISWPEPVLASYGNNKRSIQAVKNSPLESSNGFGLSMPRSFKLPRRIG